MLTKDQTAFLIRKTKQKLSLVEEDIIQLKETTQPIAPENAIGRVSRMDAINNKSVAELALRNALTRKTNLTEALHNIIHQKEFGICTKCKQAIHFKRLVAMPESKRCVQCT